MKKTMLFLFPLLLSLCFCIGAQAQDASGKGQEGVDKIQTAKVAFIGGELNLTPEQEKQFWPVYNHYQKQREALWVDNRPFKNRNLDELTDQQLLEGIRTVQANRQRELNMEKEYTDRLLKILTVRQVVDLHRAEREFTRTLLKKIENKHAKR